MKVLLFPGGAAGVRARLRPDGAPPVRPGLRRHRPGGLDEPRSPSTGTPISYLAPCPGPGGLPGFVHPDLAVRGLRGGDGGGARGKPHPHEGNHTQVRGRREAAITCFQVPEPGGGGEGGYGHQGGEGAGGAAAWLGCLLCRYERHVLC